MTIGQYFLLAFAIGVLWPLLAWLAVRLFGVDGAMSRKEEIEEAKRKWGKSCRKPSAK